MSQELTAAEAAARLGIKRATLYAYVSRGLLHRHMAMDGRTSLFDSDEVDAFRSGRRRHTEGELEAVISTSLTLVRDGEVRVRGRDLIEVAASGAAYETVVDDLWGGSADPWTLDESVLAAVAAAQASLPPGANGIERLRVTTAVVSAMDPLRFDLSPRSVRRAGKSLLLAMVEGLPLLGRATSADRLADRLWPRLTARRPNDQRRDALNAVLVLLVDHGLAASTFAVRVAASVRADPYSAVTAGLGVMGGTLHGAASGTVHEMLDEAHTTGDAATAVGNARRRLGTNPGFGHTVYTTEDPRYPALMARVSEAWAGDPRLGTVHAVRDLISQRTHAIPNVDLAHGSLTWLAGMEADAGEKVFAISRTAGWLAHAIEEYDEAPVRFRPRARYTGARSS